MANIVRNILSFDCSDKRRDEILQAIQNDELGPGSIDFNKIIPMPESLDMTSGSVEDHAISAYLTAINPSKPDCGKDKLPLHVFLVVAYNLNVMKRFGNYDVGMTESNMQERAESLRFEEEFKDKSPTELYTAFMERGQQYVHNALEYGATTWYGWCNREWGTKWNAYDFESGEGGTIDFSTAWAFPEPVIKAISKQFPDVEVCNNWADEDLGCNVGEVKYRGGEQVERYEPHPFGVEAYDRAAAIWEIDLADRGFYLREDGSAYEYIDDLDERNIETERLEPISEQTI